MGVRSPQGLGATPVTLHLHVDDADALWPGPCPRAARWSGRRKIISTASARAPCAIPSGTAG